MSTTASVSQFLANSVMVTGSHRAALNGGYLYLYSGPVPASADDAIDGSGAKIFKLTKDNDGSTGLTFQNTAVNGVLRKTTAEVWKGAALATATVTFFRFCTDTDDGTGASDGSHARVQGTVGTDATYGMILTSTSFTASDLLDLTDFQIIMPQTAP